MAAVSMQVPDIKVHVSRVRVAGLNRTKNDIVVEQIRDVLKATSLRDLLVRSLNSMRQLEQLNIFRHVSIRLDTDKSAKVKWAESKEEVGPKGEESKQEVDLSHIKDEDSIEVMFVVKEHGWISSTIAANAGTQSGDASLSFALRNMFGRAEQLSVVSGTSLPHWGHNVQLQFTKPYYKDIDKRLLIGVGTTDTKLPSSGCQEYNTGASAELAFSTDLGQHSLGAGCQWRQMFGFSNNVPLSIRQQAGHSIKSFIKHTLDSDERDDPFFPRSGYRIKLTQEVAGLGGDTLFGKAEMQTEIHKELFKNWVLSWTLWGGVMRAYSPTKLTDNFFLGGATSLRGFGMWGTGPRQNGYSLGGNAYWASGLHLFTPLPFVTHQLFSRIRIHSFATVGNLIQSKGLPSFSDLSRGVRCSCGLGLHFRLGVAQIELNYAIPLKAKPSDLLQPGLQFGVGLDML